MRKHVRSWIVAAAGSVLALVPAVSAQPVADTGGSSIRGIIRQSPINAAVDTVFTPLTPCRIIDTRVAGGAIAGNSVQSFFVAGENAASFAAQGGFPCGVPVGAVAVSINLTVVPVTFPGDIRIAPVGVAVPLASIGNWADLGAVPNAVDTTIGGGAGPHLQVQADGGTTDLVADVYGYFRAVGCQDVTVKALGQCWDLFPRAPSILTLASETCAGFGLPAGGRLGTALELRALGLRGILTLADAPGEWAGPMYDNNGTLGGMTVTAGGASSFSPEGSLRNFRCVYNPLP